MIHKKEIILDTELLSKVLLSARSYDTVRKCERSNKTMKQSNDYSIIELDHFIEATRDSGYKGTASALAELIDNSFEANATHVDISLNTSGNREGRALTVIISDNGVGMTPSVLRLALRFGGSTRFNSRNGTGRYGMGLPNSSLSRARRIDLYSWTTPKAVWWSYLDVDEIARGHLSYVPKPKRTRPPFNSGAAGSVDRKSV